MPQIGIIMGEATGGVMGGKGADAIVIRLRFAGGGPGIDQHTAEHLVQMRGLLRVDGDPERAAEGLGGVGEIQIGVLGRQMPTCPFAPMLGLGADLFVAFLGAACGGRWWGEQIQTVRYVRWQKIALHLPGTGGFGGLRPRLRRGLRLNRCDQSQGAHQYGGQGGSPAGLGQSGKKAGHIQSRSTKGKKKPERRGSEGSHLHVGFREEGGILSYKQAKGTPLAGQLPAMH